MAWLVGMSDPVKGRRFEIDRDELTIGRREDNGIPIADNSVSSHHCVIGRSGEKYSVRDLGSTNGTTLNGEAVRESGLKPKDIVRVGSVELMFDGENVEVSEQEVTRTTRIEVAEGSAAAAPSTFRSASPFGTRRDHRRLWAVAVALIALVAVAGLVIFLHRLFQ